MPIPTLKTVVVVGAAYGGARAVDMLLKGLPAGWRMVVIDRSTHFNHVYVFPRVAVLPDHEHKVFIPNTNLFTPEGEKERSATCPHLLIHGTVTAVDRTSVSYTVQKNDGETSPTEHSINYDYLIYALGARLPDPINIFSRGKNFGTKPEGIKWMKDAQKRVKEAKSVLVVGGGALGVQLATDIAAVYGPGAKKITLIHSRPHLLNRFDEFMHIEAAKKMEALQVEVVLDSRVDLAFAATAPEGNVRTLDGRDLQADLVFWCTGQTPNTSFLVPHFAPAISPKTGLGTVNRYLQISEKLADGTYEVLDPRVFLVGDCADAFGALNAGHTAWAQGGMAANNVIKMIKGETDLEEYHAPLPAIKVTLGLDQAVVQHDGKHEIFGAESVRDDLHTGLLWESRRMGTDDMFV